PAAAPLGVRTPGLAILLTPRFPKRLGMGRETGSPGRARWSLYAVPKERVAGRKPGSDERVEAAQGGKAAGPVPEPGPGGQGVAGPRLAWGCINPSTFSRFLVSNRTRPP